MTIISPWMIELIKQLFIIGICYAVMKHLGVIDYIHRIVKELREKQKKEREKKEKVKEDFKLEDYMRKIK